LVVLLVRANTITKRKKSSWTGNSIRLTFHLYIHIYIISFCMHPWFHLLLTAIDRWMRVRALVRSSERFALLHRLTCFLLLLFLLLSIFIQALYSIFICYLLPVLSSILSSFQFLLFFFTSLISFDEQQSNNNNILDEQKLGFETIFARHPYSLFSSGYAPWYNQLFTNSNIYIYTHI
jgi:hypothetical protein